jgi:hypothetical protein
MSMPAGRPAGSPSIRTDPARRAAQRPRRRTRHRPPSTRAAGPGPVVVCWCGARLVGVAGSGSVVVCWRGARLVGAVGLGSGGARRFSVPLIRAAGPGPDEPRLSAAVTPAGRSWLAAALVHRCGRTPRRLSAAMVGTPHRAETPMAAAVARGGVPQGGCCLWGGNADRDGRPVWRSSSASGTRAARRPSRPPAPTAGSAGGCGPVGEGSTPTLAGLLRGSA